MISIDLLAKKIKKRVGLNKDATVAITGFEGDGKSALSLQLGLAADPHFDIERNVLFSPNTQEIKQKIFDLPKESVIIADEAIKVMYKLNWSTKMQKTLNMVYAVCRKENKISIFNMPRFIDFSEYFRNHRIRLWLHIIDPLSNQKKYGLALLMARSWNPITKDPWGLKEFEKKVLEKQWQRKQDSSYGLDDKIALFEKLSTFLGLVKFEWVDAELWQRYETIKAKQDFNDLDEALMDQKEAEKIKWKGYTLKAIKTMMGLNMNQTQISQALGLNPATISLWLKEEKRKQAVKEFEESKLPA